MKIKRLKDYGNISSLTRLAQLTEDTVVIELNEQEKKAMHLNNDAYVVYEQHIANTKSQIQKHSSKELQVYRNLYDDVDRDLWVYDLYMCKAKSLPFVII